MIVLVIASLVVTAIAVWIIAGGMVTGSGPLATGVRIWEGLPGSGKSYGVTERIVKVVGNDRRPIYTNLPLKLRVLRAYLRLKGGDRMTGYVQSLTEDHFKAFVSRFASMNAFVAERVAAGCRRSKAEGEYLDDDGDNGPHIPRPMARHDWIKYRLLAGKSESVAAVEFDLMSPDGSLLRPNWIPYGSVVVVDELHHWYDQRNQKDEDHSLLGWLTMHRHGQYLIEVLSQDAMQVSMSFRRQCIEYVRCSDKRNLPFLFGYRFPLPTFCYELIPAATLKNQGERTAVKPLKAWVRFPWLNGGLMWRLYDSFTHCGSMRQLRRHLETTRKIHEPDTYEEGHEMKRKEEVKRRMGIVVKVATFLILAALLGLAFWGSPKGVAAAQKGKGLLSGGSEGAGPVPGGSAGSGSGTVPTGTGPAPAAGVPSRGSQLIAGSPSASASPFASPDSFNLERGRFRSAVGSPTANPPDRPPRLSAVAPSFAVIDGRVYRPGSSFRGVPILGIDYESKRILVGTPDFNAVAWSLGADLPADAGPPGLPPGRGAASSHGPASRPFADDPLAAGRDAGG